MHPSAEKLCDIIRDVQVSKNIASELERNKHLISEFSKIDSFLIDNIFHGINRVCIKLHKPLGHFGNMSIEALIKLCMIANYIGPTNIFEFGTFNGQTTANLTLNTDARVYSLDLDDHEDFVSPGNYIDTLVATSLYNHFGTSCGSYITSELFKKITLLKGNSNTFDFSPYYNQMDIVFIDGGHDYNTKRNDTLNAIRMVKKEGWIIWDNVKDELHPEVTKCLIDLGIQAQHITGTFLAVCQF